MNIKRFFVVITMTLAVGFLTSCAVKNIKETVKRDEAKVATEVKPLHNSTMKTNPETIHTHNEDPEPNVVYNENFVFDENPTVEKNEHLIKLQTKASEKISPDLASFTIFVEEKVEKFDDASKNVKKRTTEIENYLISKGMNRDKIKVSKLLRNNEENILYYMIEVNSLNINEIEINDIFYGINELGGGRFENLIFTTSDLNIYGNLTEFLKEKTREFVRDTLDKDGGEINEEKLLSSTIDFGKTSLYTIPQNGDFKSTVQIDNLNIYAKGIAEYSLK
jgi:lipoprotein